MNVAVTEARAWLGTPYVHQASVQGAGCDCLGLIRGIWRAIHGHEPEVIPPYSFDWGEHDGQEKLWNAARRHLKECEASTPLQAGQVLLFRMRDGATAKHLGLLSRSDTAPTFIHAYVRHGVIESALTDPWRRRIVARFAFQKG